MSICWENLAEIRRSRGLSLQSIADTTRISRRYLGAIESGDFSKLPGGVYNTSYVRQYAIAISVDSDEVVEAFRQQFGAVEQPAGNDRRPHIRRLDSLIGWILSPTGW